MKRYIVKFSKWLPLLVIMVGFSLFFYFELYRYLDLKTLKEHKDMVFHWRDEHFTLAYIAFICVYIVIVSIAVPGTISIAVMSGFFFGFWPGFFAGMFSAMVGSLIVFKAVKSSVGDLFHKKAGPWLHRMEEGFQKNSFNYLFALRLIPIFPFFVVNVVAAVLNMNLRGYFFATFFGIIPEFLVCSYLGTNLENMFNKDVEPSLDLILEPKILVPLMLLAVLALVPILYQKLKSKIRFMKG